jgi:N,N'-diacetyllegionaminate synthase
LGTGVKAPVAAEADVAAVARRSLHWKRSLVKGTVIEAGDVEPLRPATGLPPSRLSDLVGCRTTRPVSANEVVRPTDVDGLE